MLISNDLPGCAKLPHLTPHAILWIGTFIPAESRAEELDSATSFGKSISTEAHWRITTGSLQGAVRIPTFVVLL